MPSSTFRDRRLSAASLLIGAGLAGFLDGVVLHQIAQWHNMLSAVHPPDTMEAMQLNMVADGWFHAAVLAMTGAGIFLLYSATQRSPKLPPMGWFVGMLLIGGGAFNLVEGIVDHHLLQIHHVRDVPRHVPAYDWAFLVLMGLVPLGVGGWISRRNAPES